MESESEIEGGKTLIERAFVMLAEGQVHLRRLSAAEPTCAPLLMFHASPVSSWVFEGLMTHLATSDPGRTLIAPDTLGNGDSAPPLGDIPDIAYFADAMVRLIDALEFETVDLFGSHTGARIACEFAAAHPDRVGRVIFDGVIEYDEEMRADVIRNYAPTRLPDEYGGQFAWAFNFVRDQALYFPYYKRDPEHRLGGAMPPPEILNRAALDVLKSLGTYAKPYVAAFAYKAYERMAAITAPTLLLKTSTELPVLNAAVATAATHLRNAAIAAVAGDAAKAEVMTRFLRGEPQTAEAQ